MAQQDLRKTTRPALLLLALVLCTGGAGAMPSISKLAPNFRAMGRAEKRDFVMRQIDAHRAKGCLVFSKTY